MGEYAGICVCNLTFTERTSTFHPSLPRTVFIVAPIFFSQRRIGLHGKPFTMYKFRSMVTNAEELKKKLAEENGQTDRFIFKMKDDPRITKVGRFIRKTSLDEFPQFFNVLKGDMSLVGPRPALPEEVARYGSLYFLTCAGGGCVFVWWSLFGCDRAVFSHGFACLDLASLVS